MSSRETRFLPITGVARVRMAGGTLGTDGGAVSRERTDTTDFRFWWGLTLIVGLAFLLRLLYVRQFTALPIFEFPVGDSAGHLARAGEIARGHWLPSRPFYYCSIFYPYFLAAVLGGLA